jgi:ABC-2 type transport system ATP-binding protein
VTTQLRPLRDRDATEREEVIRTTGLTKVYPSGRRREPVRAVTDLDLSVVEGEIFGLLGPNGAGKTTTVGMLTTRVLPTSGSARVGGIDVIADPPGVKALIGVVPQNNTLDRQLTVWENLYFHGRYYGMSSAQARRAADEHLERFRLSGRGHSDVRTLSGGMAKRLMVARAILHDPAVLFLDEPTAGLDPQSRLALWEIVRQLHAEGQTILLTTHYMEEADRHCDRVAVIDHGRILALDTPAALKQAAVEGGADEATTSLVRIGRLGRAISTATVQRGTRDLSLPEQAEVEEIERQLTVLADQIGVDVGALRGDEVTLETVFIGLTGRELRE